MRISIIEISLFSLVEERFQFQMSHLAVADGLHTMHEYLGKGIETHQVLVQSRHLHLGSPVAFTVLDSAAVRRQDPNVSHAALHHPVKIPTSVYQQGCWRIEKQGGDVILDASLCLGIGDTMQVPALGRSARLALSSWHIVAGREVVVRGVHPCASPDSMCILPDRSPIICQVE